MDQGATPRSSSLRRQETCLAWFSLAVLPVYVPVESGFGTADLTSPGFVCDAIAMVLLLLSGVHSLRARPRTAIAPLCGTWGWCACLAWRSYYARVISRERGLEVYPPETAWQDPILGWVLVGALCVFAFSLVVAWRSTGRE